MPANPASSERAEAQNFPEHPGSQPSSTAERHWGGDKAGSPQTSRAKRASQPITAAVAEGGAPGKSARRGRSPTTCTPWNRIGGKRRDRLPQAGQSPKSAGADESKAPASHPGRPGTHAARLLQPKARECLRQTAGTAARRVRSPGGPEHQRDLCRARTDAVDDRTRARHRLKSFLLRHGELGVRNWGSVWNGTKLSSDAPKGQNISA